MVTRLRPGEAIRSGVEVACAADSAYLPHCAAMLHSLIENQTSPVQVHLMASADLTPELEQGLSGWIEGLGAGFAVHRVNEDRLSGLIPKYSINTWHRILLPELLPALGRVLYLDCDVIVTDSLAPLMRVDLGDNLIAAVTNPPLSIEWMTRHCEALGIARTDDYFNSGMLVMDLDGLRRGAWSERIIEYARGHQDHRRTAEVDEDSPRSVFEYTASHPERQLFPDQDSANALLHEHRLKLHPRWNFQTLFLRTEARTDELTDELIAEAAADPAIRHFEGPGHSKPWHPDAEPGDRALYEAHRSRTPWPA